MKAKTIVLFFSFLLTPPIAAEAASITYDFTGSVIQATGIYSARAGSATYTTAAPGAYESFSNVFGGSGGQSWQAQEEQNPTSGPYYTTSSVSLFNVNGAYSSDGLPIWPGSSGLGYFFSGSDSNQSFLTYRITSLTPTPLPATVWLMLSGLIVLWLTSRELTAKHQDQPIPCG